MYTFEYELSDKDYLDFSSYHVFNAPGNARRIMLMRLAVPALLILFSIIYSAMLKDLAASYAIFALFGVFSIVWIACLKMFIDRQMRKNIMKLKNAGKLPYNTKMSLSFDDDAIVEHTENSEFRIMYSALDRIVTDKDAVYLYFSSVQAFVIPFRAFADEREQKEFCDFIKAKMTV